MRASSTALACLLVAAGSCKATPDCSLVSSLESFAGTSAVACGRVALGSDPTSANACVIAAVGAGLPFWVAYQLQGIDSEVWRGFAKAATSNTGLSVLWDGDPSGGSHAGARIDGTRCGTLGVVENGGHLPITCIDPAGVGTVCQE